MSRRLAAGLAVVLLGSGCSSSGGSAELQVLPEKVEVLEEQTTTAAPATTAAPTTAPQATTPPTTTGGNGGQSSGGGAGKGRPTDTYACNIDSSGYCIFTGTPHQTGLDPGTEDVVDRNGNFLFAVNEAVAVNAEGEVLPARGTPALDGDDLQRSSQDGLSEDEKAFQRVMAVMFPIRNALMYDIAVVTQTEWGFLVGELEQREIKETTFTSGPTPKDNYYGRQGIFDLAKNPGGRDIHHDVMKFLEEAGLYLLCHVTTDDFGEMLQETHPEGHDPCREAEISTKIPFPHPVSMTSTTSTLGLTTTPSSPTTTATTTTASSPTTTANANWIPELLAALVVSNASAPIDYDRGDWGSGWSDDDSDCINTRHEVLILESLTRAGLSSSGCSVVSGQWYAAFTGTYVTNPSSLDVDHFVPLANAHNSGGWAWSSATKESYYNDLVDPQHLIAVTASANRSKGSRGPEDWKPSDSFYWCQYADSWVDIKVRWALTVTSAELSALQSMLGTCDGPPTGVYVPPATPSTTTSTTTTPTTLTTTLVPNPGNTKNCSDFSTYPEAKVWFDTYFPYYGDVARLDGDNDGEPCESLTGGP